ncbi:hypothetical protein [Clostridium sp. BSD2780061688b_171218_E8]|uniref:hypothetical protein n=2 Tax=unclassified Clostridium TaxID=2614128 RepID=UPI0011071D35|nr:hypothetical protein [Clostridium sp. BSD2780061688b_171218_E8]
MMKRARRFCVLLIFSTLGAYIGRWIWLSCDHAAHPGFYEQFSAPWYAQMLPYTLMVAGVMATEAVAWVVLRLVEKRRADKSHQ